MRSWRWPERLVLVAELIGERIDVPIRAEGIPGQEALARLESYNAFGVGRSDDLDFTSRLFDRVKELSILLRRFIEDEQLIEVHVGFVPRVPDYVVEIALQ